MRNQLGVGAAGLMVLGVTLAPQIASAQAIDPGDPRDIRMHPGQAHVGQGGRSDGGRMGEFGNQRRVGYGHDFGARSFSPSIRFGVARHFPVYAANGHRRIGHGVPYAIYPIDAGSGAPGAGCSSHRNVSLTPLGWHKIVTVRTCYVR